MGREKIRNKNYPPLADEEPGSANNPYNTGGQEPYDLLLDAAAKSEKKQALVYVTYKGVTFELSPDFDYQVMGVESELTKEFAVQEFEEAIRRLKEETRFVSNNRSTQNAGVVIQLFGVNIFRSHKKG